MVDHLTRTKRSWNMSRIRSANTRPEKVVRSILHAMGYRYRLHRRDLPGKPDIVLPKYNTVIFVHGCFWHRHRGCTNATTPQTNAGFWEKKFSENVARDRQKKLDLEGLGWNVVIVWECETEKSPEALAATLQKKILVPISQSSDNYLLMVAEKMTGYGDTESLKTKSARKHDDNKAIKLRR